MKRGGKNLKNGFLPMFPSGKTGQVTVFIIVGIIILAATAGIYFISSYTILEQAEDETMYPLETASIQMFVEGCLESVGEEGIFYISESGGFYNSDDINPFINYSSVFIPFYFDRGDLFVPTLENIESELNLYVVDNIDSCLSNFSYFETEGWNITNLGDIEVNSFINRGKIDLNAIIPLKIEKNGNEQSMNDFSIMLMIDFVDIYSLLGKIMKKQEESSNSILIGDISQLSYLYDFSYEITTLDDGIVMYSLFFDTGLRYEFPLRYNFMAKYNWGDE
jgi:hypothetical protein